MNPDEKPHINNLKHMKLVCVGMFKSTSRLQILPQTRPWYDADLKTDLSTPKKIEN